jgi:hypothetical protein
MSLYTLHEDQGASRAPSSFTRGVRDDSEIGGISIFADFQGDLLGGLTQLQPTKITDGAEAGGVVKMQGTGTANQLTALHSSIGIQLDARCAFEVRVKKTAVSNSDGSVFLGLVAGTIGNSLPISGTDHAVVVNAAGFFIDEDDTDSVGLVRRGSGSAATIQSSAISADTFFKIGFVFDPQDGLKWYFNGVEQSSSIGKADVDDATKFPASSELLSLVLGIKSTDTGADTIEIDWVKFIKEAA